MTKKDLMIQDLQEENRKLKEKIAELEKGKWISCSKGMPEDGDNRFYMCTVENHE